MPVRFIPVLALLMVLIAPREAGGEPPLLPQCLVASAGESVRSAVAKINPAPAELLARLVYAEGFSTGFPDDALVYQAIAWGVMNRVRLGQASPSLGRRYGNGISGVIFRKGQFNPAVSSRSPFSRAFLCPQAPERWQLAAEAAQQALREQDNPFIQTPWEKAHGLSLMVNFYYPHSSQARGNRPPWEGDRELVFIADPLISGVRLGAERIRLYRLRRPPVDLRR